MAKKGHNPLLGLVCGLAAGAGASALMDQYWAIVEKRPGDRPEQKKTKSGEEEKPSTQRIADALSDAVTGHEVSKKDKAAAGVAVHYATGVACGGLFGLLAVPQKGTGLLAGLAYGAAIWLFLDEIGLRVVHIAPDPREVPSKMHMEALGAHLVYGSATALLTRLLLGVFGRSK
ncbi:MAG: DUF1440 domain-containing protein [Chloroflexota bacterium]|nr:DUF1440 domain-containing protein [Chloroflexota bacterium]